MTNTVQSLSLTRLSLVSTLEKALKLSHVYFVSISLVITVKT